MLNRLPSGRLIFLVMNIQKLTPEQVEQLAEDYSVIYVDRVKKIAKNAFEDGFMQAVKLLFGEES